MTPVMVVRAEELIARLMEQRAKGDPGGLYGEAIEQLSDLAEAFAAAQEVIEGLRLRADRQEADPRASSGAPQVRRPPGA